MTEATKTEDGEPVRRRLPVGDVGLALTIVTCLMIVVGFLAVRRLIGDTPAPVLEVPSATAEPAEDQPSTDEPTTRREEPQPQVLRPLEVGAVEPMPSGQFHEASRPVYAEREAGWYAPTAISPESRNANRDATPRYR